MDHESGKWARRMARHGLITSAKRPIELINALQSGTSLQPMASGSHKYEASYSHCHHHRSNFISNYDWNGDNMGEIEIHTAQGWVALDDIIQGQETCTVCLAVESAEGAGYVKCDPPELMIYLCRACRPQ